MTAGRLHYMRIVMSQGTGRFTVASGNRSSKMPKETHESKALFNQAVEFLARNQPGEAMKRLEVALQISPRNAEYMSYYGLCVALELEDHRSAIKLCERAVKIDRGSPVARVNLGKVYRMEGKTAAAYDQFLGAWKADRSHPAPAAELSRMGIRRPAVLPFLARAHWLNVHLGRLRARVTRRMVTNN